MSKTNILLVNMMFFGDKDERIKQKDYEDGSKITTRMIKANDLDRLLIGLEEYKENGELNSFNICLSGLDISNTTEEINVVGYINLSISRGPYESIHVVQQMFGTMKESVFIKGDCYDC